MNFVEMKYNKVEFVRHVFKLDNLKVMKKNK